MLGIELLWCVFVCVLLKRVRCDDKYLAYDTNMTE